MLVGYNTNVPYKGKLYHIQTEDNGLKNPVIVTLLYFKGVILASKKVSYAGITGSSDYKEKVRELMKEQHKTMMKELIHGTYAEKEEGAAPPSPAETIQAGPETAETPGGKEAGDKGQISTSLDDILLDFIIRRGE